MTNEGKTIFQPFSFIISEFSFKKLLKPENRQYLVFRVILLVVATLLISANWYFFDRRENYTVGYPSTKTYFALTSARYEDRAATLELRQRAAARIVDVMVQDEKIAQQVAQRLNRLERKDYAGLIDKRLLTLLHGLSEDSQNSIVKSCVLIGRSVAKEAADKDQQSSLIWDGLRKTLLSQSEQNIAFQLLDSLLNPSLQSDSEMASRLRDDVAAQIPTVVREISPGAVLVQKGQVITPSLVKLLKMQGYPDASFPLKHLAFILLAIIIWSFWPIWIEHGLKQRLTFQEWVYTAFVLSLAWALEVLFARTAGYSMAVLGITGWLCLTLPVSLSYHIIFGGGIISVLIAFGTNPGIVALGCILAVFAASIGRMMFLDPPTHRGTIWKKLFILGIFLGIVSVCIHWGLGLFYEYSLFFYALLFSFIWSTIVIALLPIWENLFDVISPLRLLELSDPSQPLLKRLQIEAPGTYHHILMVGSLAETAADRLGLNGLLLRAGSYYHDIGKLKNPRYFVENQMEGCNVHDELSPLLSATIIISHVKDGLQIAEENKLPQTLRRFIAEHHGTTVQRYFYKKAVALGEEVTEDQFKYPGPRPQSIETALVMFADSVEAGVKARRKPFDDVDELRTFVEQVIHSKIEADQLRDTDFTMKELSVVTDSFVDVLQSTYHTREVQTIAEAVKEAEMKRAHTGAEKN